MSRTHCCVGRSDKPGHRPTYDQHELGGNVGAATTGGEGDGGGGGHGDGGKGGGGDGDGGGGGGGDGFGRRQNCGHASASAKIGNQTRWANGGDCART